MFRDTGHSRLSLSGDGVPSAGGVVGCGGDGMVAADGLDAEDAVALIVILSEATRVGG